MLPFFSFILRLHRIQTIINCHPEFCKILLPGLQPPLSLQPLISFSTAGPAGSSSIIRTHAMLTRERLRKALAHCCPYEKGKPEDVFLLLCWVLLAHCSLRESLLLCPVTLRYLEFSRGVRKTYGFLCTKHCPKFFTFVDFFFYSALLPSMVLFSPLQRKLRQRELEQHVQGHSEQKGTLTFQPRHPSPRKCALNLTLSGFL